MVVVFELQVDVSTPTRVIISIERLLNWYAYSHYMQGIGQKWNKNGN